MEEKRHQKSISDYKVYLDNKERAKKQRQEIDELNIPSISDVLDMEEYYKKLDEENLIEAIENLKEVKELEDLKDFVLKQIKFLLKYGTVRERIILLRELLKYLYPQKKQTNVNFTGGINLLINPKIVGDNYYDEYVNTGDNISEDGTESEGGSASYTGEISQE